MNLGLFANARKKFQCVDLDFFASECLSFYLPILSELAGRGLADGIGHLTM